MLKKPPITVLSWIETAWEVFFMELPKNITQVGEADKYCKIYMEDYVISYIKQMNHLAEEQKKAVAFYGKRRTEGEISYIFC